MLSLRQQVGSYKLRVGRLVGNDADLRGACRHVDSHVVEAHLLLGSHHILVARAENLVDLGNRLCAESHRADGLNAASLENLADASHAGCHQDSGVDVTLTVGWGAEHNLAASGNLRRRGQHEYRREEGSRAAGDVETDALDGHTLLPANDAGLRLHLLRAEPLRLMELVDVVVSQLDSLAQLCRHKLLGSSHLSLADG